MMPDQKIAVDSKTDMQADAGLEKKFPSLQEQRSKKIKQHNQLYGQFVRDLSQAFPKFLEHSKSKELRSKKPFYYLPVELKDENGHNIIDLLALDPVPVLEKKQPSSSSPHEEKKSNDIKEEV